MRYGFKVVSLMLIVAGLCVFLLSGCGAKVCAFGNIGECPKGGSGVSSNSSVSGGRMSIDTIPANVRDLRWGQTITLRVSGGRPTYTCQMKGPGTCSPEGGNSFKYAPGSRSSGSDDANITIYSGDYDFNLTDSAPKNQGKYAKILLPIYN